MSTHSPPHGETRPAGHEPDRVNVRMLGLTGVLLGITIAGSLSGLWFLYHRLQPKRVTVPSAWRAEERPPIDFDQPARLRALREWEQQELNTYGWRNPEKTAARVPIERAMEMLVENGDPFLPAVEDPTKIEPAKQPDEKNEPETESNANEPENENGKKVE